MSLLFFASVFSVGLGLGLAMVVEDAGATGEPALISLLTALLGFSRTLFILTVLIPPFILLTKIYLDSGVSWNRRVFWVPMAVFQVIGMILILAIPCVRRIEDYYPTVVLWSMYVGCGGLCLSWLPVFKHLGIKIIWSRSETSEWEKKCVVQRWAINPREQDGVATDQRTSFRFLNLLPGQSKSKVSPVPKTPESTPALRSEESKNMARFQKESSEASITAVKEGSKQNKNGSNEKSPASSPLKPDLPGASNDRLAGL
jgi:hypothetical protein